MHPSHHPPLDLLAAHTAGWLAEDQSLLVASHLELCPACRSEEAALEKLGGELLEGAVDDAPPSASLLDAVLRRLDEPVPPSAPPPALPAFLADLPIPTVLHRYLADVRRWSLLLPGIQEIALPVEGARLRCSLLRFKPGVLLPRHGHGGRELSLVLQGGFDDQSDAGDRVFLPGDLSCQDPEDDHEVRIHEEGCLVVFAREGRLLPRSLLASVGIFLGQL